MGEAYTFGNAVEPLQALSREAALVLIECLRLVLVEQRAFTTEEMIDAVETANRHQVADDWRTRTSRNSVRRGGNAQHPS